MAWKLSAARWPSCKWSSGAAPTRPAATVTGGGRQRRLLLRPRLQRRPSLPLRLVRPCRREGRRLRCQWASPLALPCLRETPFRPPRPFLRAQRLEAVRPGPPRPAAAGRPAASRCRRSRRWMPGCRAARPCSNPLWCPIARCHARLAARRSAPSRPARLPNWRLARPVAPRRPPRPSALSGRPRPARQQLLRTPPQPAVLLRAFPPRPRASRRCSRLTVRLPALAPATRASGLPAAPLSQTQKASAEDAFGAGLFVMQLTCWASTPCRPPGIERRRARR